MRLWSENQNFKNVVEMKSAPHGLSGSFTLKFLFMNHVVDHLKRSGSLSPMGPGPYEHSNVLMKKAFRMSSRWLSTRVYETVERVGIALDCVLRPGRKDMEVLLAQLF